MIDARLFNDILHKLLFYVSETGELYWKPRNRDMFKSESSMKSWNTKYAGKKAGCNYVCPKTKNVYIQITILGRRYLAHQIVMVMLGHDVIGKEIDHIDGDGCNNSEINLRIVNHIRNSQNAGKRIDNISGTTGVSWNKRKQKWFSYITANKKRISLGYYDDKEKAIRARKKAEVEYGFHPNHGMRDSDARRNYG